MTPRPAQRRAGAAVVIAAVGLLLTFFVSGPAAAHAVLQGTNPEDGAVLDAPPDELVLTFNEPVQALPDETSVLAGDGSLIDVTVAAVDHTLVITPSAPLADGAYVVSWRIISLDTHPVAGAFAFDVGTPSGAEAATAATTDTADDGGSEDTIVAVRAAVQALFYAAVLTIVGLIVFELLVLRAPQGALPLRRRLQRVRVAALVLGAVAVVLSVPLTAAWQLGTGLDGLTRAETWEVGLRAESALAWAVTLIGLTVATFAAPRATRGARAQGFVGIAVGAIVFAVGPLVLVGHTRTFGPAWLVMTADIVHVLAGSVWLGGVLGLALVLTRSSGVDPANAARTVARFSTLGAWVVVALAVTGGALGWQIMGGIDGLLTTSYGRTLLLKVGVVAVIVAIAGWNRFRLVPAVLAAGERDAATDVRAAVPEAEAALSGAGDVTTRTRSAGPEARASRKAQRLLGRTVAAEAVLILAVLGVTGVLVSTHPGEPSAEAEQGPFEASQGLGDGTVDVHVAPGRVGTNTIGLELVDADGEPLEVIEVPELSVALPDAGVGPLTRSLTEVAPGRYEVVLDLPLSGDWVFEVSARPSRFDNPITRVPVDLAP